jgi:hypothetical protein
MPLYAQAPGHTTPPPRALNGGLYTGAPFLARSGWGNVPLEPDSNVYIRKGLTIGHTAPPGASSQAVSKRPGSSVCPATETVVNRTLEMEFPM